MRFTKLRVGRVAVLAIAMVTGASSAASAQVERAGYDQSAFSLGTLTPASGAMSRDLWEDTERASVGQLLDTVPTQFDDPLHLELLRRALLSPGAGPADADNALAGKKFMTAAQAGFYREAASLAELVPGLRSEPALAQVIAFQSLMDGDVDDACARGAGLRDGRTNDSWIKLRFVCYARAGEGPAAELTLNLLRRQDIISEADAQRYTVFAAGRLPDGGAPGRDAFDYVMARERGFVPSADFLRTASAAVVASIARNENYPPDIRQQALLQSVARKTIDMEEAWRLLDRLSTTPLAAEIVSVNSHLPGSLEQAEALGSTLRGAGDDWLGFVARTQLLATAVTGTSPVTNYAPYAPEIALAGMVLRQPSVVEAWILALASDETNPENPGKVASLLNLYAQIDPGAARRIGSYVGVALDPQNPVPFDAAGVEATTPLLAFVSAGLEAAEAGSQGPAALLYLTGLNVAGDGEHGDIRNVVMGWARNTADLDWLDRQAAFREDASLFLTGQATGGGQIIDGKPLPRPKPANN